MQMEFRRQSFSRRCLESYICVSIIGIIGRLRSSMEELGLSEDSI